jgi:hypothetical protein
MDDALGCHISDVAARNDNVLVTVETVVRAKVAGMAAEKNPWSPRSLSVLLETLVCLRAWVADGVLMITLEPADRPKPGPFVLK